MAANDSAGHPRLGAPAQGGIGHRRASGRGERPWRAGPREAAQLGVGVRGLCRGRGVDARHYRQIMTLVDLSL
jgi:hypothetical protein